jgi:ribonuclease-3
MESWVQFLEKWKKIRRQKIRKMKTINKDFSQLEKILNINFKNKNLLIEAFCHRSFLNENPDLNLNHNERLEFLGDAVLELIVTEYLFKNYPEKNEGELTAWRAALVNAKNLSEIAEKLKFNDFLLLSKGEAKETGKGRKYILANAFEALIGAIYLDQGYKKCKDFIIEHLIPRLKEFLERGEIRDPKSIFQEKAQEKLKITPVYKVLKEWGPDHAKNFLVGVFLGEELVATGEGSSKQEAELEAAKKALKIKGW